MSTILETKPKPAVYIIEEKELFDLKRLEKTIEFLLSEES